MDKKEQRQALVNTLTNHRIDAMNHLDKVAKEFERTALAIRAHQQSIGLMNMEDEKQHESSEMEDAMRTITTALGSIRTEILTNRAIRLALARQALINFDQQA